MKVIGKLILGLLILTPGLYASEYTEDDAKKAAAHGVADDEEEVSLDPVRAGFAQLAKQTPEQTEQAYKLKRAVFSNNVKEVKKLLDEKADVHARTQDGRPIIRFAFDSEVLKLLLDHKAQVNAKDYDKSTILHWTCHLNKRDSTLLLLKNGADVNAQDVTGNTPLHYCLPNFYYPTENPEYVTLLLEHGANPTLVNLPGPTLSGQTCLDALDNILHFTDTKLRISACKMILALDEHGKRIDEQLTCVDMIKTTLLECHANAFTTGVDDIVLAYICAKNRASKEKLEVIFKEFGGLFKQLRESGQLS